LKFVVTDVLREFRPYFVNAQIATSSVTDHVDNSIPEQMILYKDEGRVVTEIISRRTDCGTLLQHDEAVALYTELRRIHTSKLFKNQCVDVEFIVTHDTGTEHKYHIYIVQARPHDGYS
jgi:hypothetical protein